MSIGPASEFKATASIYLAFEPFIDGTDGTDITSGDTASVQYYKPDGTLLAGGPYAMTRDSGFSWRTAALAPGGGNYVQGLWTAVASSSDPNAVRAQRRSFLWGVGLGEDVATVDTAVDGVATDVAGVVTDIASLASDVANVDAAIAAIAVILGTPEGASLAADTQFIRQLLTNRRDVDRVNNRVIIYDDSDVPMLVATFRNELGIPTVGSLLPGDVHQQLKMVTP